MGKLERVDFLRGIAILLVFTYHASLEVFGTNFLKSDSFILDVTQHPLQQVIVHFLPSTYGGYGVWLFLAISGFLIHLGYLRSNL